MNLSQLTELLKRFLNNRKYIWNYWWIDCTNSTNYDKSYGSELVGCDSAILSAITLTLSCLINKDVF